MVRRCSSGTAKKDTAASWANDHQEAQGAAVWVFLMVIDELVKTARREAREGYARFLLKIAGFEDSDIEVFLNEKQAVLEDRSPLEMIYSGDYDRAVAAVETLVDGCQDES
jgi:hypothetical protein